MEQRTIGLRGLVAVGLALTLVSCGGDDGDDATGSDTAPASDAAGPTVEDAGVACADQPVDGGRLVVAGGDEATAGYMPWTALTGPGAVSVATAVYDTLAAFNAEGEAVPLLAESWESNEDGTEWTVTLRPDITFHDGSDLTAEAIVLQFESAREAGRVLQEGFEVEQVDELTARFTFQQPFGSFPASLASQWGWIASPTSVREMGAEFPNHPVGTGPYEFVEWVRDDHITLVRNEDYWRDDVAHYDEIEYRPIIDDGVRRAALLAGDVDAIVVGEGDIGAMRDETAFETYETLAGTSGIGFNMTRAPLDDLRVRQALSYAIDVDAVIETLFDGVGTRATGPFPRDNPFYVETDTPTYDPERAASLIEEYEAETGREVAFEYLFTNSPLDQELAQLLQTYWQDVGATVTLGAPLTGGDHFTRRVEQQYDVSSAGMPAVIDPDVWSDLFRSTSFHNYSGHTDEELDRAADDGRANLDPAARAEAYERLQVRLAELLPTFHMIESVLAVAARPDVRGLDAWTLPDGSAGLSKQFWVPFTFDALWHDPSCA